MRAKEFIVERKKKSKRRKNKYGSAVWGPGPYGLYGWNTGYSGDGGAVSEASYPGNIGIMELIKFMQKAGPQEKAILQKLIAKKNYNQAWAMVQGLTGVKLQGKGFEDRHHNDVPYGPETKPTMPAGTVRVDVSDVYDWYKLGMHIANLKGLGHHDFGKGPPSTIISFGSEEEEHEYIKNLMKLGLTTTDIDPLDPNQPKSMPRQKVDPTYNVENFADGKNPGRKGLSKRVGIPKKASLGQLEKIASSSSGERRRMAQWQLNMRRGKKK